jgi:hypothetical protein
MSRATVVPLTDRCVDGPDVRCLQSDVGHARAAVTIQFQVVTPTDNGTSRNASKSVVCRSGARAFSLEAGSGVQVMVYSQSTQASIMMGT